jgi:hypothetical protein
MCVLKNLQITAPAKLRLVCFLLLLLILPLVARADLVFYLSGEDAVNPVDESPNPATIIGHGSINSVEAQIGNGLEFDGNNANRIEVQDASKLDGMSAISIAVWVRPRNIAGREGMSIVSKRVAWEDGDVYNLFAYTSQNVNGRVNANNTNIGLSTTALEDDTWYHIVLVFDGQGEPGEKIKLYVNGILESSDDHPDSTVNQGDSPLWVGELDAERGFAWDGILDEVRIYNHALSEVQILSAMLGKPWPYALGPDPADGALHNATWVTLTWTPGELAASHDIYIGENYDDVFNATRDSDAFQDNLTDNFSIAGFSGYPYPDGLVPGTTYYWRIDEVNDSEPNSPWKGDVWSFSIPPKTAYSPDPADRAEFVQLNAQLKWTAGIGAILHYVVFGEDFDEVSNAAMGVPNGGTTYNPGPLERAKTYYWRADESDGFDTYKGRVWSFTTEGAVSGPNPANAAVDVSPTQILTWNAGDVAASHEVYFGSDADAVANATTASPEYKGPKALGDESYDPGKLTLNTTYYWRIDEVNNVSPDSPWKGNVWSFSTGNFFVIDDFEIYDANDNQIWYAWHDGLGYGVAGTDPYYAGNGTGAAVGDETTASYTEETIVHGPNQSVPIAFDNDKQGYSKYSEVEYTLTDQRDWTAEGVTELSLWFRGHSASVGSFIEEPSGTYTMTGSGADIWAVDGVEADEFHFAYKTLTGAGSIIAKVESVDNTNGWAKAGVMIRESLNPDSAHAFACVTPGNGVASQYRPSTGGTSGNFNQTGITAPYWVKLERSISGLFTVSCSVDGASWQPVTGATAQNISMGSNVYIGLALTSHDATRTCQAVFSNITTTGSVTGQWANQDIGIASNDAEPLYVAVSNSTGNPAVVVHDDTNAAQIDTWTEWVIPLSALADQGINLANIDRIAIGLGTQGNTTVPGGKGKMYIDDIRLYQPREAVD